MKVFISLAFVILLASCKTEVSDSNAQFKSLGGAGAGSGSSATYKAAYDVMASKCFSCHTGDSRDYGSQDEESWSSHGDVKPGDPEGSALYDSIVNNRMPMGGPYLRPDERNAIREWILGMNESSDSVGRGNPVGPVIEDTSPAFIDAYQVIFRNCVPCHAPQNSNNVTSFDISTQLGWAQSGFIASQDSASSLLFQRISDGSMPPDPLRKLSPADREKISTWIDNFEFTITPLTTGGNGGGGNGPNAAQRLAQAKQMLMNRCNGCHTNGGNAGGFSFGNLLDAGASYQDWDNAQVNNMQLFEPGNPNGSRIFVVLRNSGLQPADMPTNVNNAFNDGEITFLRNWIIMANQP